MNTNIIKCLLAASFLLATMPAQAVLVSAAVGDKDCSGYFNSYSGAGNGFSACQIFASTDINRVSTDILISPVIAKFHGDLTLDEISSSFTSVTGSEWNFSDPVTNNKTGTWTYAPAGDDPGIRYWSAKGSDNFLLFWDVDQASLDVTPMCSAGGTDNLNLACLNLANTVLTGTWATSINNGGQQADLSHIVFV